MKFYQSSVYISILYAFYVLLKTPRLNANLSMHDPTMCPLL